MRTSILGKVHFVASKYDPETRAKAVRLVLEHRDDYPSEWAAITAVSKRLGMTAETLRSWVRQHQIDDGQRTMGQKRHVRRGCRGSPLLSPRR
jgi:transposase-like protein